MGSAWGERRREAWGRRHRRRGERRQRRRRRRGQRLRGRRGRQEAARVRGGAAGGARRDDEKVNVRPSKCGCDARCVKLLEAGGVGGHEEREEEPRDEDDEGERRAEALDAPRVEGAEVAA